MRRAAVVGSPVAHSLSPVIHRAGYEAAGLSGWSYEPIECGEDALATFVAGLGPEWAGLSLTMPLKEVALSVADQVAPLPAALGAANTLVPGPDGGWQAENTDAPGIAQALGDGVGHGQVVVLGAGGTARAALGAAAKRGAGQVTVVARRAEAIERLEPVGMALGITIVPCRWSTAPDVLAAADLVLSTVPRGVADSLAEQVVWRADTVLLDALYDPWPTPLAAAAGAAGCRVVSGLDLLLAQAVSQFELFTGVPAPRTQMHAALMTAVASR
jgi:shikimate dehydrogenase